MHAATIVPQEYLALTQHLPYHMALAHLIEADGYEVYTHFYKEIIGKDSSKYLIMDNGVIEGDPRPIKEILAKAVLLGADELVLPDVFKDCDATLDKIREALPFVKDSDFKGKLMAVPQGKTYAEWLFCAQTIARMPEVDVIGIPKVLVKLEDSLGNISASRRLEAIVALQELFIDKNLQVHLLGCWHSPLEIKTINHAAAAGKIMDIRGTDSAISWLYSQAGMKISDGPRPQIPVQFDAPLDTVIWEKLKQNICMWQHECGVVQEDAEEMFPIFW